ncbi:hypothetical protein GAY33_07980 [Azospirillum brasilense]|uniref:hypothetical protein n=1 Tax=Azospirillum argentinense TaxID=2970906 RepID=UPI00190AB7A6|nr:hypothetical protein [Azospirillum argentinense]MBK3799165.1 hypothetical protein [Azospirillum argentinense]
MRNLMIAALAAMLLAACSGMDGGGTGSSGMNSGGPGSGLTGGGTSGSQGVDEPNVNPNGTSSSPGPYNGGSYYGSGVSEPQSRTRSPNESGMDQGMTRQSLPNRSGTGW